MGLLGPFAAPGAAGTPVGPPVHPDDDLPRLGRALRWPRDFGAHLGTRIEWWYVTGVLHAATAGQLSHRGTRGTRHLSGEVDDTVGAGNSVGASAGLFHRRHNAQG